MSTSDSFPQKIVINRCYGGFSLSKEAADALGLASEYEDVARDDPRLVELVETWGARANGDLADLKVVEVPEDVAWEINEYDGMEWVAEVHRTWS